MAMKPASRTNVSPVPNPPVNTALMLERKATKRRMRIRRRYFEVFFFEVRGTRYEVRE
jgi:hypothetical protein